MIAWTDAKPTLEDTRSDLLVFYLGSASAGYNHSTI